MSKSELLISQVEDMDKKGIVLVVDDEPRIIKWQKQRLESRFYIVHTALSGKEALNIIRGVGIDVLVTDIRMPGMDGIELIKEAIKIKSDIQCIVITGYGELKTAIEAIKLGVVSDYLCKPVKIDYLDCAIQKAIGKQKIIQAAKRMLTKRAQKISDVKDKKGNIIGKSNSMKKVFELIARVSRTNSTVLITGETGTGKELVAKAIHENSPNSERPFVLVNCVGIPETIFESELFGHEKGAFTGAHILRKGSFEMAGSGTIFLDEIGDLPENIQIKLLRVLQEGEFNRLGSSEIIKSSARVIAATNKRLKEAVASGVFRADLFYRLNVIPIILPPLRERREDIPLLVEHFIKKQNQRSENKIASISAQALNKLIRFEWPGNVRELEKTIERAFVMTEGPIIEEEHIIFSNSLGKDKIERKGQEIPSYKELRDFISQVIKGEKDWDDREGWIFDKCEKLEMLAKELRGDGSKMAKVLNVSRNNLGQMLKRCEIELKQIRKGCGRKS